MELLESRKKRIAQLRQRLVAVSLRSRSLRLTRASRAGALDLERLAHLDKSAFDGVLGMLGREGAPPVALCDVEASRELRSFADDVAGLAHASETAWLETGARDLAVGWPFLEGRTTDGTWIRAPLLLYPVRLGQTTSGRLSWNLEALGPPDLNESLAQALVRLASVKLTVEKMLEHDDDGHFRCDAPTWQGFVRYLQSVGFTLPPPPDELPPFEALPARVKDERDTAPLNTFTLRPHVVLGRFPRSDSSIVGDYDELLEGALDDARLGVAAQLLGADETRDSSNESPPPPRTGDRSARAWQVFPSDDSQDEALLASAEGGLVVQGPPGTGKSQMIANLLAAAIADGKRVLVVCQKRAALDVVADRLSAVGLREPVAVVYDVQRDRGDVCDGIARTLAELGGREAAGGATEVTRDIEERSRDHARAFGRLGARLDAAQEAWTALAGDDRTLGLAELLERSLGDDKRVLPVLGDLAEEATEDAAHACLPTIELLTRDSVAIASPHPLAWRTDWRGKTAGDLGRIFERVRALEDVAKKLDAVPAGGLTPGEAAKRGPLWDSAAVLLDPIAKRDAEAMRAFLLGWVWTGGQTQHGEWQRVMELLRRARERLKPAPSELVLEKRSTLDAWIKDLTRLEQIEKPWYRFFNLGWWKLRKLPGEILGKCSSLTALASPNASEARTAAAVRVLCEQAIPWQELIDDLPIDNALFDLGLRGDVEELEEAIALLETQHARTRAVHTLAKELAGVGGPYAALPDLVIEGPETLPDQPFLGAAVRDRSRAQLFVALELAARALDGDLDKIFLDDLIARASKGETGAALARVSSIVTAEGQADEVARFDDRAKDLAAWARKFLRDWQPVGAAGPGDDALLALERAWLALATKGRNASAIETALVDPELLARLSEELDACLSSAGRGIRARWQGRVLEALADRGRGVALRKLGSEVTKKRYRATMRQLVERYWDQGLSSVRPIWFCSPESVASLFPLTSDLFDLVVLDEASQCPVEAALPTLARSKRALVAGDDQQMPPTHFFRAAADDEEIEDEDGEELSVLATSSILGLSRVAFPGTVLRWHYRSRHEELVAFSNAAFYGRKLITAPRAEARSPLEGLRWVKVDGLWQEQTNEVEASRIVDLVAELLAPDDAPSVGVIAFNKKQSELVERLLDQRASRDDAFRRARERDRNKSVVEQLFVRNLENVQGDERDVILLSLAYGPSSKGGKVHARFGPIGLEGGEKRLNVAITRARIGLSVVTSVEPEDLDVSGTKHLGPKLLRTYLELVRAHSQGRAGEVERLLGVAGELGGGRGVTGGSRHSNEPRRRTGERVCRELAEALEARGLRTQRGVGLGHRRLDLAVGRLGEESWLFGVDCTEFLRQPDGMSRDVYTPRFWERLGWKVLRVSPAAWAEHRERVIDSVLTVSGARTSTV